MRKFKLSSMGALSVLIGAVLGVFAVSPAIATPDPNTQGGNSGVVYFAEAASSSPGIYIGDFSQASKTAYWTGSGSSVDLVAVTERKVAWASTRVSAASNIAGTVMISNVGLTASTPITVTIPRGTGATAPFALRSLTSDPFGELFYITTTDGDIWSLTSDGVNLTKVFDGTTDPTVKAAVGKIYYGSWFDPYNSNFYFCSFSQRGVSNEIKSLMKASVSGVTMSLPTPVLDNASNPIQLDECDGVGVNPATQEIITLKASGPTAGYPNDVYNWSRITSSGLRTDITNFKLVGGTDIDRTTYGGTGSVRTVAPSSMFISHSTSKMYFATETAIFETDFDGNNTRALYTGGTSFQSIAVYYGATVSTIDSIVQNLPPLGSGSTSGSSTAAQNLANTGMSGSLFFASGALGLSLMALGGVMVSLLKLIFSYGRSNQVAANTFPA